ncbi:MAG: glycosyltransferase family 4 protein [candidate division KSB1 bacterium]|nr:glycosyltransferase family 4 protein [candidate division KSB1 bacterium]MDZ7275870.1 glycosyltransferase family 4 protein [candidate division KSB1 bacterium]MDZ7287620.1 glycosyltransferase family 4 protein [candidate division KSB1 bacterium]MDZ7309450.1 glycosyltransferase family 4 protein [candidate division KSB1 bacterium]MDZ7350598.1 glycosyltransferase family 4 protein [candidate division KSB1 bacterium]
MRIGIDATCLPPSLAGAGRYVLGLIRGLASLERDHEYYIFVKKKDAPRFTNLPANMHRVELPNYPRPLRLVWQHFCASSSARRHKLDIWHGTHYALPRPQPGVRLVSTFHDLGVFLHPEFYPAGKRLYFQAAITQAARRADHILAVSKATARDYRRFTHRLSLPDRHGVVTVIASGVHEEFFVPVPEEHKQSMRQKYAGGAPYLLFVGTCEKRKNLGMLIEAFRRFALNGRRDHVLLLAGQPGNGSRALEQALAAYCLHGRVRLLGYVPEMDLPALYQAAALVVLPSHYEGFGFPLLEAMAGGAVALAANNSALRELAGHRAMLCDNDAGAWAARMAELVDNQELRRELCHHGRRHARRFTWRKTAEQMVAFYESLSKENSVRMFPPAKGTAIPACRNGMAAFAMTPERMRVVAEAALRTLAYADLFDYPLARAEIHEGLPGVRATPVEVAAALQFLHQHGLIAESCGFFFLADRRHLPELRAERRELSRHLLQRHRRILARISKFPFVRTVALSGALAFENGRADDDIDLFLIVDSRRLWTVYAGLVLFTKLLGKRRIICLNCLVGHRHLAWPERDFFIAHQIVHLLPLSGTAMLRRFMAANAWCRTFLPQAGGRRRLAHPLATAAASAPPARLQRLMEAVLALAPFDQLERLVFMFYRRRIQRRTQNLPAGAVTAQAGCILLFTNDHRFRLRTKLEARLQPGLARLQAAWEERKETHACP